MIKKICTKCNAEKIIDLFHAAKYGKLGKASMCKKCKSISAKKRKEDPLVKKAIYEKNKIWEKNNPEKVLAKAARWRRNNPESVKETAKKCTFFLVRADGCRYFAYSNANETAVWVENPHNSKVGIHLYERLS